MLQLHVCPVSFLQAAFVQGDMASVSLLEQEELFSMSHVPNGEGIWWTIHPLSIHAYYLLQVSICFLQLNICSQNSQ